ncbi:hypothetical protein PR048_010546 [Dryococelus australis]|uniref:Uncharacterized protein n=1 Tax=Dryococelus australis TaxID=614101 RepID=A0ABQ9I3H2_9NEOP|nr:hypothetical protein PR048_010546 [Dryococelus australis]
MEQRRNARVWGNREIPEKTKLASGIVRHDSHLRKSGSGPDGDRTRFAIFGGAKSNRSETASPYFFGTARMNRKGRAGDPRDNPPTSGIVWKDPHMQKSGSGPAGNRTLFALAGGE